MSFRSARESLLSQIIPPRPSAPVPPSPVSPYTFDGQAPRMHAPPPQILKRTRSKRSDITSSTILDPEAPIRHRKRHKADTGHAVEPRPCIDVISDTGKALCVPSQEVEDLPASPLPSPSFDTSGEISLKDNPISRSVVWSEKSTTSQSKRPHTIIFTPKASSDLFIRSGDISDGGPVGFYVDKATVFSASPVLRTLASEIGTKVIKKGHSYMILTVDEPASSVEELLRLVYPVRRAPIATSAQLDRLLSLSRRYNISQALHFLCSTALRDLAVHEPLRAYGLACAHSLYSEITWTAQATLRIDLSKADITFDLARCSARQIQRLVSMHTHRARDAYDLIYAARSFDEFTCPGDFCEEGVAEWWVEVVRQSKKELKARPSSDNVFSPMFLAGCVRVAARSCSRCPESFFNAHTQHRLARLKDDIDALPSI